MRLVVDPGVLVSALITPLGPPARLWQAARAGTVQLIVSPRLLAELAGVLEREKFRRYVSLEESRAHGRNPGGAARRVGAHLFRVSLDGVSRQT